MYARLMRLLCFVALLIACDEAPVPPAPPAPVLGPGPALPTTPPPLRPSPQGVPQPSLPSPPAPPTVPTTEANARVGRLEVLHRHEGQGHEQMIPLDLCRAGDHVAWTNSGGELWVIHLRERVGRRIEGCGGRMTCRRVSSLACTDTELIYDVSQSLEENTARILRRTIGDAPRLVTDQVDNPVSITTDGELVYWDECDGRTLDSVPLMGGEPTRLARGSFAELVPFGDYLYWADYRHGAVRRIRKTGGRVETVATGLRHAVGLTVDDDAMFISTEDDGGVHRRIGRRTERLTNGWVNHDVLQRHGDYVYWYSWGQGPERHSLVRMAASGDDPEILVDQLFMPVEFAVADDGIAFGNKGEGTILWLSGIEL